MHAKVAGAALAPAGLAAVAHPGPRPPFSAPAVALSIWRAIASLLDVGARATGI
jgi:hypothetical protein